jgi:hypothetical protein
MTLAWDRIRPGRTRIEPAESGWGEPVLIVAAYPRAGYVVARGAADFIIRESDFDAWHFAD